MPAMAMIEFRRKQLVMAAFSLPAFVVVGVVLYQAKSLFGFVSLPADEPAARMIFCCAMSFFYRAARSLLAFKSPRVAASMPTPLTARGSRRATLWKSILRYNQNTLEQLVLAAVTWLNLSLVVNRENLLLIPAMACLFVVGRLTFWMGYLIRPVARAFGMILTALPTIGSILWLVLHCASVDR